VSFLASGIGGILNLGGTFAGLDAQRKNTNKLVKLQQQSSFASGQSEKTLLELAVIGAAAFGVVFVLVRLARRE